MYSINFSENNKKCIGIYNIGCITMKKQSLWKYQYCKSIISNYSKVDGYVEENNGNKYLVFISTDGNKEVLAKFTKLWHEIKCLIEIINGGKKGEYETDFMNIWFESDGNLPLNKILKLHMLTVIVRSVFKEDDKYYPQVF